MSQRENPVLKTCKNQLQSAPFHALDFFSDMIMVSVLKLSIPNNVFPTRIYLFKVNYGNIKAIFKIVFKVNKKYTGTTSFCSKPPRKCTDSLKVSFHANTFCVWMTFWCNNVIFSIHLLQFDSRSLLIMMMFH